MPRPPKWLTLLRDEQGLLDENGKLKTKDSRDAVQVSVARDILMEARQLSGLSETGIIEKILKEYIDRTHKEITKAQKKEKGKP